MENGTNLLAGRLAIFRINYKSDFILTLQSDAGWAIPFCIKFWTGVPSEAYYAGWDGTTYTNCAPVVGEPSKLQVQFDDHHLPIGELKYQISYHFTVDDFPTSVEDEVINQGAVIIDNDGINEKVLLDFNGETAPEIQFSLPAYANEAQRIANEQQRIENEQQRIENEQTRVGNEETRIVHEWERQRNEQTRITQEEARERAFTQMQRDSESATSAANVAATLANQKAQLAQEKAEYAQQQGDFAKAQGETAQLDHTKAAGDHQTAAADHQTAVADHQIAAADHQTAESDHTRADQDHTDVQNAIAAADLVYDISKAHATGGVLATYADLSAALGTNGANVPVERRQGGMVVQFVRSSDNNYVQYFLTKNEWSASEADWEKINIEEELNQLSQDLQNVISDTMDETQTVNLYNKSLGLLDGYINSSGGISQTQGYKCSKPTPVVAGHYYYLSGRNFTNSGYFGIRCLDGNGNPLKVLCAQTGEQYAYGWNLPNVAGTNKVQNGQFLVPTSAVSVEFTVTANNVGDDSQIMLIDLGTEYTENPSIPSYVRYGYTYKLSGLEQLNEEINDLDEEINGVETQKTVTIAYNAVGKYINGANQNGAIYSYAPLSLAYFKVQKGVAYRIVVKQTTNSAGWEMGFSSVADGSTSVTVLSDYGKGTWASETFDYTAADNGYLVVGYATDTSIPTVSYVEIVGGLVKRIENLEDKDDSIVFPSIKTPVMFFGDSLTAASTVGVVGFAELIANWLKIPYRPFVLDSGDGNTSDVPVDYVSYTNYAKDGTRNCVNPNRTQPDSVVERVKRHITADSNVSVILIECCVNDKAYPVTNKGVVSDSYTATYDVETTLGAIEETIRYITTLGKPFKLGFFIPWEITWGTSSFFDDHILIFKKWGIPYLDLRDTAGFNMRDCVAHRIYSLTTDNYPAFSDSTTYNTDDIVKYAGMLYKCKYDDVVGKVPTDTDYWIEIPGGSFDGTHLNNTGHEIVCGKILNFLESL